MLSVSAARRFASVGAVVVCTFACDSKTIEFETVLTHPFHIQQNLLPVLRVVPPWALLCRIHHDARLSVLASRILDVEKIFRIKGRIRIKAVTDFLHHVRVVERWLAVVIDIPDITAGLQRFVERSANVHIKEAKVEFVRNRHDLISRVFEPEVEADRLVCGD